jgi:pyruvate/2-oxoacid:ferredoxin oxidoreductase alpha subunit/NAD-dependent dihydropyrimidine dehydrogenase PreA subunit
MPTTIERPRPVLVPDYCKGCARCVEACTYHCIDAGSEVHPATGLVPVLLDLERCTGCGLCFDACPEPYALHPALIDPADNETLHSIPDRFAPRVTPEPIPDALIELAATEPVVVKGMYASAIGAIFAGCRHFFGYPITPSTEGAELMARLLPRLDGQFLQAVSEVAAINMLYGAGAAGVRAMTFTSSPGFSLMLEGFSYMIGANLPGVVVNVMRGGPGLGNIAPAQSDIKLACRGLGHGDTHAIVLTPSTPQEMLDLTMDAFELSFRYRNPVIVLADGYLGQMTGKVTLPRQLVRPGIPAWATAGDAAHRGNLAASIHLSEAELEAMNRELFAKYDAMAVEARADLFECDDAEIVIVACNTPSRMAKKAVRTLRARGVKAGLFRPLTLWPFPIAALTPLAERARRLIVVEASARQLEDELRLAVSYAAIRTPDIERVWRCGGMLPSPEEIVDSVVHA